MTHTQSTAVQNTLVKMINSLDRKEWNNTLKQFDKNVFVDYSSMNGVAGSTVKSNDLVGGWEKLLKRVNTHHMLTNFEISIDGDEANTSSHVYASHTAKNTKYWDIYGRYIHRLKKSKKGWKITSMKLIVHGQKGNTKFLQQVNK